MQAYNVDDIKNNSLPKDKHVCRIVGETYRVPIYSTATKSTYGKRRREAVEQKRRKLDSEAAMTDFLSAGSTEAAP